MPSSSSTPEQRSDAIVRYLISRADPLARESGDNEWASASSIAEALGASVGRTTIFRDLQQLVADQVVDAQGPTRSRVYRLNKGSTAYIQWELQQPPESRAKVPYNPGLLLGYDPNATFWLSTAQRKQLAELAQPGFKADEASYRRVMNNLMIDLSYASSRLEDVRISWLDTKSLVELGERPEGLTDKEYRIVMNHKDAIQFITENRSDLDLSLRTVFDVHKLLSRGLLGNPADEGRIRQGLVFFHESAYQPVSVPFVLEEQMKLFCDKARAIQDPFEQAFFTMAMISYLQPFRDGNKRTSRLCMNIPLLRDSLAPFSFAQIDRRAYILGLLAFYERGRPEFLADAFTQAYMKSAPRYRELLDVVQNSGVVSSLETEPLRSKALRRPRKPR